MTNQTTVRINWEEYIKESAQKNMRGYPESAMSYPEVVEIDSYNDDGTITVIIGYNDFGTPMVVRVDPTSEFVMDEPEPNDNSKFVQITISEPDSDECETDSNEYLERMGKHMHQFYDNVTVEYGLVAIMKINCEGYDEHEVFQTAMNLGEMF